MRILILIILAIAGTITSCAMFQRSENKEPDVLLKYCLNMGYCFSGLYQNGLLKEYVMYNSTNDMKTRERIIDINGNKHDLVYSESGDTTSYKLTDNKDRLVFERKYYKNKSLKYEVKIIEGRLDTSEYQLDGKTILVSKSESKDTVYKVRRDSTGNIIEKEKLYFNLPVETEELKDSAIIFHTKRKNEKSDTLVNINFKRSIRNVNEIMVVVRTETKKLRHTYNKYLKNEKFDSKIALTFNINPIGSVEYIYPQSFSYGTPIDFVNEITKQVSQWKYLEMERGYTTVTIPFSFSDTKK